MKMTLYSATLSPFATRNRIQIRAKGIEDHFDIAPRPSLDAYRLISPTAKLPTLDAGNGLVLVESDTIAEFIEDCFPNPSLRGNDPASMARVRVLSRILDIYFFAGVAILDAQLKAGTAERVLVAEGLAKIDKSLHWIDHYLDDEGYAVGDGLTLADCALASGLFFTHMVTRFGHARFLTHNKIQRYFEWINEADPYCAFEHQEMSAALALRLAAAGQAPHR